MFGPLGWSNMWMLTFWIATWYIASLSVLLLNKTILSDFGATSHQLGSLQTISTAIFGGIKVFFSMNKIQKGQSESPFSRQVRSTLFILALLRSCSVILGLMSLKHVPASFTETIKSTAPLFTVYFQHIVLGMRTSPQVLCSLLPIMIGLIICAHAEISFNAIGFWSAVFNNIIDCLQNVVSKKALAKVSPIRLQFYTSILALLFQIPFIFMNDLHLLNFHFFTDSATQHRKTRDFVSWYRTVFDTNYTTLQNSSSSTMNNKTIFTFPVSSNVQQRRTLHSYNNFDFRYFFFFAADVIFYHLQSVSAYFVVSGISPVSMSVANTLKRSILIALSIAYFGNQITSTSVFGVIIVIAGVCIYNQARIMFPPPQAASSLGRTPLVKSTETLTNTNDDNPIDHLSPEHNDRDLITPTAGGPLQHLTHHTHRTSHP